jgi:hypothetical protein
MARSFVEHLVAAQVALGVRRGAYYAIAESNTTTPMPVL